MKASVQDSSETTVGHIATRLGSWTSPHEHNDDGSEMTAGQKAKAVADGGHAHHGISALTMFSLISNGLLLVLLVLAMLRKAKGDEAVKVDTH